MAEQTNVANFTRIEDFVSLYANNVQFEQSEFDLKLIFGQLDQVEGKTRVEQHGSVTISWLQAKIFLYFLQLNLAGYEHLHGKIKVPDSLLPPPIELPTEQEVDPALREMAELFKTLRERFFFP